MTLTNWAGNHTYVAARVHRPTSLEELRTLVAGARLIRPLGSRHSFTDVADTTGDLVSTSELPADLEVDTAARQVRVAGGVTYGALAAELHRQGLALPTMASLPHISVAGAVATGTHGSGLGIGSLATTVVSLELLGPDGSSRTVARGDDDFAGHVVGLGALGVVTHLTLEVEPTFEVSQTVFLDLPWEALESRFEEIVGSAYSVSVFTRWVEDVVGQVWLKARVDAEVPGGVVGGVPASLQGARPATAAVHMLAGADTVAVTPQLGEPGPWSERLPHFRREFTPSRGEELQSEYLLPRTHAVEAVRRMRRLGPKIAHLLQTCELRTISADDLWLSPTYDVDAIAVHWTWLRDVPGVTAVLPLIEEALLPLGARPHWGKVFTVGAEDLEKAYPRMDDFRRLRATHDPQGKFDNDFLRRTIGGLERA